MSDRKKVCDRCHGIITIPARRRNLTLEMVVAVHEESCPSAPRRIHNANA